MTLKLLCTQMVKYYIEIYNFKYYAHIFFFSLIKHCHPYTAGTPWITYDSTICVQSSVTIQQNMNRLFDPLLGTE